MIISAIVEKTLGYYSRKGDLEYGENVTQLQHAFQAAELARDEGYDEEVILAAFLHDIGHLIEEEDDEPAAMGEYGIVDHEGLGATFLRRYGFSEKIAVLVENHVTAKRYLTFKNSSYYDSLSEASKETLRYQGGPMSEEEASEFEAQPFFELCVKMRYWDDAAKITEKPAGDAGWIKELMNRHLQQQPLELSA